MGGNIFPDTRRATEADFAKIEKILIEAKYDNNYVRDYSFIGSWGNRVGGEFRDFGDVDLVILSEIPTNRLVGFDFGSRKADIEDETLWLTKSLFPNCELRETNGVHYVLFDHEVQVDVHHTTSMNKFDWIKRATTVPENDTFKPLYRNELLFNLPRFTTLSNHRVGSDHKTLSYTRLRFNPWMGAEKVKYDFGSRKTPSRSIIDTNTNFFAFLEVIGLSPESLGNPTFMNLVFDIKNKVLAGEEYSRFASDVVKALEKKNVPVPRILK